MSAIAAARVRAERVLPDVLCEAHLSPVELRAARLSGELMEIGGAYCVIDVPLTVVARARAVAASIAPWGSSRLLAVRLSAAWVYGATPHRPDVPEIAMRRGERTTASLPIPCRQFRLDDDDVDSIGGLRITSPERTLWDLLEPVGAEHPECPREIDVISSAAAAVSHAVAPGWQERFARRRDGIIRLAQWRQQLSPG